MNGPNAPEADAAPPEAPGPKAAGPIPHTQIHGLLRRALENVQDAVVVGLMLVLLGLSAQALWNLARLALSETPAPAEALSAIIYLLILVELYRLLIFYLREHRISVALAVEVALVSTLRDVMLKGAHELEWPRLLALGLLLVVLGGLLALERWMGHRRNEVSEADAR